MKQKRFLDNSKVTTVWILYLITNWCCLFRRWLSSNILISSSIKMVNVKVSGFCCRLWISTQNNTTLVQGLETLITIVLNLYIFSLHTLLRHEIRYLWIRARYEQNMTGALGEVPRGSHDTRVYSSDPWCGHWWAQHLRSGAPVVTSCDPWWWMAGVALAHDKEFKGTLFQVDHVEIRGALEIEGHDR